jgi:hypothetical protein
MGEDLSESSPLLCWRRWCLWVSLFPLGASLWVSSPWTGSRWKPYSMSLRAWWWWHVASLPSWGHRQGASSSWREASSTLAWSGLTGCLSCTHDLIVTFLGTHYVLAGSVLHNPKWEGMRPSLAIAWCGRCMWAWWSSKATHFYLVWWSRSPLIRCGVSYFHAWLRVGGTHLPLSSHFYFLTCLYVISLPFCTGLTG